MRVCCSSGKARIYYNIPVDGGLKYRLKGSTKWQQVKGNNERLTSQCVSILGSFSGGQCNNQSYRVYCHHPTGAPGSEELVISQTSGKVDFIRFQNGDINYTTVSNGFGTIDFRVNAIGVINGVEQIVGSGYLRLFNYVSGSLYVTRVERVDGTSQADDIAQCGTKPTKRFTVTGETTGTKYREIEVKECPDVQNVGCIFDPARERFVDVDLAFLDAPVLRYIPGFPNALPTILRDCVEVVTQDNAIQIRKVGEIGYFVGENVTWISTGLFSVVKQLDSPEGCPPPRVKIECCPNGICGENKKCPPGTDCQMDCDGFRCCYDRNGKLIRTIKL